MLGCFGISKVSNVLAEMYILLWSENSEIVPRHRTIERSEDSAAKIEVSGWILEGNDTNTRGAGESCPSICSTLVLFLNSPTIARCTSQPAPPLP